MIRGFLHNNFTSSRHRVHIKSIQYGFVHYVLGNNTAGLVIFFSRPRKFFLYDSDDGEVVTVDSISGMLFKFTP
jgi:hypothetical protein